MSTAVLATCLNAALDITYRVPHVDPGATHRVTSTATRAGGKGINVARVLAQQGNDVIVTGLAGGTAGAAIRADLAASSLREMLVEIAEESRRTVTVVDDAGVASLFAEPGPLVTEVEWSAFFECFSTILPDVPVAVVAGSIPPGLNDNVYAQLVEVARRAGVPTIVDVEGPALIRAAVAGAAVVKPNIHELKSTLECRTAREGAQQLLDLGAETVVVSLGSDGLLLCSPDGNWHARLERPLTGNPTGAGDAVVAALARGLVCGAPWASIAGDAVALSAAAVHFPLAGGFDAEAYQRYHDRVIIEDIT